VGKGASIVAGPCVGDADAVWEAEYGGSTDPEEGWVAYYNASANGGAVSYIKLDEHMDANTTTKADFCRRGRVYLNPDAGKGDTHQGNLFYYYIGKTLFCLFIERFHATT